MDAGQTGQQGHHRLVRAAVDGQEVPRHHRLEEPEQVRRPVQDLRVRRQGPAARRRPVLRHQRRGAGQEPQAQLQGGLRRQRGGADRGVPAGRGEEEAVDRLLLRAAVVPGRGAAGPGQPARRTPTAATPTRRRSPATTRRTRSTRSSRKKFADSGSPAVTLVKNFKWTNDDQNVVAKYIAEDKMSADDAAKKWIEANPDKVDAWLKHARHVARLEPEAPASGRTAPVSRPARLTLRGGASRCV